MRHARSGYLLTIKCLRRWRGRFFETSGALLPGCKAARQGCPAHAVAGQSATVLKIVNQNKALCIFQGWAARRHGGWRGQMRHSGLCIRTDTPHEAPRLPRPRRFFFGTGCVHGICKDFASRNAAIACQARPHPGGCRAFFADGSCFSQSGVAEAWCTYPRRPMVVKNPDFFICAVDCKDVGRAHSARRAMQCQRNGKVRNIAVAGA